MKFFLIFLILAFADSLYAQPQSILLLDDFEQFPLNSLGNETAVFDTLATITREVKRDCEAYGGSGKTLQLNYDVSPDTVSSCGAVSFLAINDLSAFHYLSFRVKGNSGNEFFQMELKRENGESSKISI